MLIAYRSSLMNRLAIIRFEIFFSNSTQRAYPIIRNIFKLCSGFDSAFRITYLRIVNEIQTVQMYFMSSLFFKFMQI